MPRAPRPARITLPSVARAFRFVIVNHLCRPLFGPSAASLSSLFVVYTFQIIHLDLKIKNEKKKIKD
jgi:hypothetical protein